MATPSAEYECLSGSQLYDVLDKLNEYAAGGWELVTASYEPAPAYGKPGCHYLFIRRPVKGE